MQDPIVLSTRKGLTRHRGLQSHNGCATCHKAWHW